MTKSVLVCAVLALTATISFAQNNPPKSPPAEASVTIAGKAIKIK